MIYQPFGYLLTTGPKGNRFACWKEYKDGKKEILAYFDRWKDADEYARSFFKDMKEVKQ